MYIGSRFNEAVIVKDEGSGKAIAVEDGGDEDDQSNRHRYESAGLPECLTRRAGRRCWR